MEPSRQTGGRRRRELLALSREIDALGARDQSAIVYGYADGWTVRRVESLWDQQREGQLLRNCLRALSRRDENCWSLRDPDNNLPRLVFAAWRVDPGDDLSEVPEEVTKTHLLRGEGFLLMVDTPHGLKEARRAQLLEFANAGLGDMDAPWFPISTRERLLTLARAHNVGGAAAMLGLGL